MAVATLSTMTVETPPGGPIPWILTFVSMLLLPLNAQLGSAAIGVFLLLWLGYAVAWPAHAIGTLTKQALIWIFPGVALISTLWSIAPDETFRHAVQLIMTTIITIVLARSTSPAQFLSALTCALVPEMLLGAVVGGRQITETGAAAATGLFDSKNFFAQHISLMMFACIGTLTQRRQPGWVRAVALAGLLSGPFLLLDARSIGALVTIGPCLLIMVVVLSLNRLPIRIRPLAIFGYVFVLSIMLALIVVAVTTERNMILGMIGKGSDLTGRDYLWYRAAFLIKQRPTLGVGYQAFWIQGNLDAEGLWRAEHIASRSGFHFHSYFYETVVELGYLGFAIVTTQFLVFAGTIMAGGLRKPSSESAFFCAIVVFYALRCPVELDFVAPFGLSPLLLPAGWVYALQASKASRRVLTDGGAGSFNRWQPPFGGRPSDRNSIVRSW